MNNNCYVKMVGFMEDVSLYLLNSVIRHVGFYKNGKYKNKHSSSLSDSSFLHHLLSSISFLSPSPTAFNLPPATNFNMEIPKKERLPAARWLSKQQAPAWARGHSSLMLGENLSTQKHCPVLPN